jgi:YbbR domain-containing protein
LTGNKRDLDALNVRDLMANVDVSDLKPGEHYVQLTPERVTMGLPDGVRYGDIQPNNVLLRLEPRIERELEVEVRKSGKVPEGYDLRSITATPDKVKVRGPASHVNALQSAQTEIIPLDGRKESFTLPQVIIEIADKRVDLITTVVSVNVEIEEQRIEKSFKGIAVVAPDGSLVRPETASVRTFTSFLRSRRTGHAICVWNCRQARKVALSCAPRLHQRKASQP